VNAGWHWWGLLQRSLHRHSVYWCAGARLVVRIGCASEAVLTSGKAPLSRQSCVSNTEPQAPRFPISGITLLVVDDDPSFRRALRRLLELERISVVEADGGESAIRAIEGDEPRVLDAVLTDVAMPGVFGHELIEVFRENRPSLPVVAMSGWTPLPVDLVPVSLLHKPFDVMELIDTIGPLVLTPEATLRRARRLRLDAARLGALAERQHSKARGHGAKSDDLMKRHPDS
jgi:CheY-like chemotaxis protein